MMVEHSISGAADYLGIMFRPKEVQELSDEAPVAHNTVGLLFVDLAALDLLEPSKKKHPVSDVEIYWSLTEFGREVLKSHRVVTLELIAAKATPDSPTSDA